MLNHGVTFHLNSAEVCSLAIFETYFSYRKDICIAVTYYYIYFYLFVLFPDVCNFHRHLYFN